jgi:hypothetical protein
VTAAPFSSLRVVLLRVFSTTDYVVLS